MDLDERLRRHLSTRGEEIELATGDPRAISARARRRTRRHRAAGALAAVLIAAGGVVGLLVTAGDDATEPEAQLGTQPAPGPVGTADEATEAPAEPVAGDPSATPGGASSSGSSDAADAGEFVGPGVTNLVAVPDGYLAAGDPVGKGVGLWASPDGQEWRRVALPPEARPRDLAVADGRYVILARVDDGDASTGSAVYTSEDLETWRRLDVTLDVPADNPAVVWAVDLRELAAGPAGVLALGWPKARLEPATLVPDGVTLEGGWSIGGPTGGRDLTVFDAEDGTVAWSAPLTDLGLSDAEIDSLFGVAEPVIVRIDDAIARPVATVGLEGAVVSGVTAFGGGFALSGHRTDAAGPAAWTSADGQRWESVVLPAQLAAQTAPVVEVGQAGGTLVVVGSAAGSPVAWSSTDGGRTWTPAALESSVAADAARTFETAFVAEGPTALAAVYTAIHTVSAPTSGEGPPDVVLEDRGHRAVVETFSGQVTVTAPDGAVLGTFDVWQIHAGVVSSSATSGAGDPVSPASPARPTLPPNIRPDGSGGFVVVGPTGEVARFAHVAARHDEAWAQWSSARPGHTDVPHHRWLAWSTDGAIWDARALDDLLDEDEWITRVAVGDGRALLAIRVPPTADEMAAHQQRQEELAAGGSPGVTVVGPSTALRFVEVSLG